MHLAFVGANPAAGIEHGSPAQAHVNYILGNDRTKWHTNLPTYDSITYRTLYPGIDLTYQGDANSLKGTYTVASHADPSLIRWRYSPVEGVSLDEAGNLQIGISSSRSHATGQNELSTLMESAPVAWQEIEGRRVAVRVSYRLLPDSAIGFSVGTYDPNRPLIIDPTLVYNRSFGGSSSEVNHAIAVNSEGNAYIAGITSSPDFPLAAPYQGSMRGLTTATSRSSAPTALLYSTRPTSVAALSISSTASRWTARGTST